tara:strand:+ start:982 stop:1566 length:585 start_codon:yes stop_codon:yes gene_type:complete
MNKKTAAQILLSSIILIISLIIFLKYFNQESKLIKETISKKEINENLKEKSNIIKDIKYLSKDDTGNIYSISAEFGEIKEQNSDIIYLENVKAKIKIINSDDIDIESDFAKYNSKNYDTNFYENTKVRYSGHKINCKYLDLLFNKNLAILHQNILYTNLQSSLMADRLEIDLITKNSTISMKDKKEKIKILYTE